MRSVRMIVLGVAALVCALGVLSAPAFANKKPAEPKVFGKFVSTSTGPIKGHGEVFEMKLGPYTFTGKNLGGGKGSGPICESELKSSGMITAGEHENLTQNISFKNCFATRKSGTAEEAVKFKFGLGIEFHGNRSANIGEAQGEMVVKESKVFVKGAKSTCEVIIPEQIVPIKAEKKPENEFEAASYETEEESLVGEKGQEKKFGPVRKRLDIEMEFKKIKTELQLNPEKGCTDEKLEEGSTFNPETNRVSFKNGILEAELEEITIKTGNLSFEPAVEV
jgi:hypothetical protein